MKIIRHETAGMTAGVKVAGGAGEMVHTFAYQFASGADAAMKTESLGRQTKQGVGADGTRTSFTIDAGKIGNDRPIEVTSESWFSPELQVVVESRHSDPRVGETVYQLTGINRTEPDRLLFEIPADFRVTESKGGDVIQMRLPKPEAAKP